MPSPFGGGGIQETPFLQNINILEFHNFLDAPPFGGGIQETPFLQNINILSFSNFLDALPPKGGSLLPNNFVFGQHKNI